MISLINEITNYKNEKITVYTKIINFNNNQIKMSNLKENEHIFNHFTIHRGRGVFYENALLEKIKSMNIKGTYIDCGANIGNHSVYFLNFTDCNNLISIEGHDKIFDILKYNVDNNNIYKKKVNLINNLVGDKIDNSYFINLEDENNCGVGYVNKEKGLQKNMITIDSLKIDDLSLIKLDVENYEFQVLLGSVETIKKYRPVIIIELHETNPFYTKILEFLKIHNYESDNINYAKSPTFIYTPIKD
jgi:FkbM family methyltransferase